jgi:hypothetical protein
MQTLRFNDSQWILVLCGGGEFQLSNFNEFQLSNFEFQLSSTRFVSWGGRIPVGVSFIYISIRGLSNPGSVNRVGGN